MSAAGYNRYGQIKRQKCKENYVLVKNFGH